ncbi:hypothetical protein J5Y03_03500 [Bacillus sp. RG28]|uniref:Uncharacterized protein n=1 Tax=Gottfriedia endophytica TaxID=2820819 RepID=A0A940SJH6_9BACI|nr:hypothetical protein [Gottfriedia endophytica]MBP0724248.1 hypothetical protein [Gottfriedia endophytica]
MFDYIKRFAIVLVFVLTIALLFIGANKTQIQNFLKKNNSSFVLTNGK